MKHPIIAAFCIFVAGAALADDIKTADGKEYKGVTVSRINPDGIEVMTDTGIERIPFSNLPADLQKKYGYDPDKEAKFNRVQQDAFVAAQKNQQEAVSVAEIWKPYTDLLDPYKTNIPLGEEKKAAALKTKFEAVQTVCQRYLDAGTSKDTVANWVKCTLQNSITKGMPSDLVLICWGKPDEINSSSDGPAQWVYGSRQYVYVQDGIVTSWQSFGETP